MGAHRCCVSGCPSRRKEVRMHKFPTDNATNRERVKIWINHCRREGWQPKNRNAIICDKHFDISQYEIHRIDRPPDNRKLRQTAIPTLFPGVPEPPKIPKQKVKPVRKPKPTNQLEESNQESSDAQKPSGIPGEKVQLIRTLKPTDRLEESNNDCPDVPELPTPREKVKPVRKSKCTDQREKSTCKSPDTSKPPRISGRKLKPIKKPKLTEYQFEELNYETKVVDWESLVNINIEVNGDEINNTDASDKKHQRQKRGQKAAKTKSLEKATEDEELIMNEEYDFFNDNPTTHPIHEEIPLEISPPECSFIKVEEADYEFLDENQTAHLISEEITLEDLVQPESSIIKELLKEFVDEEDLHLYSDDAFNNDLSNEDTSSPEYVEKLHEIIKKQKHLIKKLCHTLLKLKKTISTCDTDTQTDPDTNNSGQTKTTDTTWKADSVSLKEMVKEAAEDAMKQTGFVYESTSGLYYDYNTGYYYNAELGLYYDGNSGTYYRYNESSKSFEFHSRVEFPPLAPSTSVDDAQTEAKRKKKSKKNLGNSDNVEDELTTRKKVKRDHESDAEEGECSEDSSSSSDISSDKDIECIENSEDKSNSCVNAVKYNPDEVSKAWPPCMRIIVKETNVKNLKTGTLFMITYDGGTLGREGDHNVLIPDVNISKYHAKFSFDTKDAKSEIGNYTLTDLGSRNGTFIDGKRLSTALQESEPHPILHDTSIRVGGTTLLCHVHPGRETCPHCEPGLLISSDEEKRAAYVLEENMSEKRKNELRKLKKKFGFKLTGENNVSVTNPEYKDRAEIRRQTVGSHSDSFKTEVASVTQPIKKTNKGFKMLAKMGWSEGESLGAKSEEGITEPILVQQRVEKVGLGYDMPVEPELSKADKKKQEMWKKTQIRYHNLPSNQTS